MFRWTDKYQVVNSRKLEKTESNTFRRNLKRIHILDEREGLQFRSSSDMKKIKKNKGKREGIRDLLQS